MRDSAGVEIVENGRVGAWGEGVFQVREVLRIGEVDGPEELQFYQVGGPLVGAGDTIYVPNSTPPEIRVYAPDGRYVRAIGREGQGPGEFRSVSRVSIWADTVVVGYTGNGRAAVYLTDGTHVEEIGTQANRFRADIEARAEGGWVLGLGTRSDPEGVLEEPEWRETRTQLAWARSLPDALARFGPDSVETSEAHPTVSFLLRRSWVVLDERGGPLGLGAPWAGSARARFDRAGRIFVSDPWDYRFSVYTPEGVLVRETRRDFEPVPIDEELRGRYRDELLAQVERGERELGWSLEAAGLDGPEFIPPIDDLRVSGDGVVWIKRQDLVPDPLDLMFPPTTTIILAGREFPFPDFSARVDVWWDVFETDGRFMGTVELPPGLSPGAVGPDWVIGVLHDEMGVEYIARYEVEEVG